MAKTATVTIKKYANRRLYNTATSTYVTLENLAEMIREGVEFNVYDVKTGADITRSVLTQIIVEAEVNGKNLLPVPFLRQLISFYGGNVDNVLGSYLEQAMNTFTVNRDKLRETIGKVGAPVFPMSLEEMSKQNMAMFERTVKIFSPFAPGEGEGAAAGARMKAESERSLEELQAQFDKLQKQIGDILKARR
jgi:polyhydroxyalkanoate synthesis repressor PhaR